MAQKRSELEETTILHRYIAGESATQIAKSQGVFTTSIIRVLRRHGIVTGHKHGKDHPNWKGGRVLKNGYPSIWMPTHDRANNVGYVKEHMLVMEKKLGRKIRKDEPIHHIDFNRENNNIDNLWLCSQKSHITAERSIQKLIVKLIERKIVKFNRKKGVYEL